VYTKHIVYDQFIPGVERGYGDNMKRERKTVLFLVILLGTFILPKLGGPSQTPFDLEELCKNIDNSYKCAQAIERFQLKHYPKYVTRKGNRLELTLKNGKIKIIENSPETDYDDVEGKHYSFREYIQSVGYFLIHVQYWEGSKFLMVHDKTGKEFLIPEVPELSPDKDRLVSVSGGTYQFNGIQIWKFTSGGLVLEWTYEHKEYDRFTFNAWADNKTIKLYKFTEVKNQFVNIPQILKLEPAGWQLVNEESSK